MAKLPQRECRPREGAPLARAIHHYRQSLLKPITKRQEEGRDSLTWAAVLCRWIPPLTPADVICLLALRGSAQVAQLFPPREKISLIETWFHNALRVFVRCLRFHPEFIDVLGWRRYTLCNCVHSEQLLAQAFIDWGDDALNKALGRPPSTERFRVLQRVFTDIRETNLISTERAIRNVRQARARVSPEERKDPVLDLEARALADLILHWTPLLRRPMAWHPETRDFGLLPVKDEMLKEETRGRPPSPRDPRAEWKVVQEAHALGTPVDDEEIKKAKKRPTKKSAHSPLSIDDPVGKDEDAKSYASALEDAVISAEDVAMVEEANDLISRELSDDGGDALAVLEASLSNIARTAVWDQSGISVDRQRSLEAKIESLLSRKYGTSIKLRRPKAS